MKSTNPSAPLIRLTGLGLTYPGPPPFTALEDGHLKVFRGQHLAIVGPSGSGKTSLLNIIGMLDRPTHGIFELGGVDVAAMGQRQRAALRGRQVGFVFQAFHLLPHRTALENVSLASLYLGVPRKARMAAAHGALERVGLAHRTDNLPSTLSGGEKQRVAIARAVAHGPSLLLCDEPTGNLDSASAANVLALLGELHEDGMTVIVITHDMSVAARAERIIRMADGRIL